MIPQFYSSFIIVFFNSIVVRIFLFALGSNKYSQKIGKNITSKFILLKKITGIAYWKGNSVLLKFSIIILVASYFFILYCLTVFILSKVSMLNDDRLISLPLRVFCFIFIVNFFLLCIKLYL